MKTSLRSGGGVLRFNLRSLLAFVALLAFGLTALKLSTHGWAVAVTTLTAALLFVAGLRALFRRDAERAYWLGAIACGGGYLALLWVLKSDQPTYPMAAYVPSGFRVTTSDLATTELLDYLFRKFNPTGEDAYPVANTISVFEAANYYPPPAVAYRYYAAPVPAAAPAYAAPALASPPAPASAANSSEVYADPLQPIPASSEDRTPPPAEVASFQEPAEDTRPTRYIPVAGPAPSYVAGPSGTVGSPQFVYNPSPTAPEYDLQTLGTRLAYFPRIGHCLFAIVLGWIGGLMAVALVRPRATLQQAPASVPAPV